uniref:Uncharacterized protein n=1 Tax=Monodon monoceros TaxID=40151 RepID=A0A8C6BYK0_MONMO
MGQSKTPYRNCSTSGDANEVEDGNYGRNPRLAGTRRLMIEIPGTPPCYFTNNQSEESHVHCSPPHRCYLKNPSLKGGRETQEGGDMGIFVYV